MVDDHRAVLYGGRTAEGRLCRVFLFNFQTRVRLFNKAAKIEAVLAYILRTLVTISASTQENTGSACVAVSYVPLGALVFPKGVWWPCFIAGRCQIPGIT